MTEDNTTPQSFRAIRAKSTPTTITVYQAFSPEIAEPALRAQKFVSPFLRTRMTWIKPSFLWMAYRCGWATKPRQERVLAIEITREGFEWALKRSCLSHVPGNKHQKQEQDKWRKGLRESPVRVQWDPERDLWHRPLGHRSIQIGLSKEAVGRYVDEWIVSITEVTALMGDIKGHLDRGEVEEAERLLPEESVYPLSEELREILQEQRDPRTRLFPTSPRNANSLLSLLRTASLITSTPRFHSSDVKFSLSSHFPSSKSLSISTMLEARLEQASLLKRVADAIKDLVQDCNFDCNDSGIALQAMDNSHVALVSMLLKAEGFSPYRCDRNIALGINLVSLTKVLRAAQNEDVLTLKAEDTPDAVNLMFESAETDRISEYDIKLMDIDQEHLAIPETEYAATVEMPSAEFQRICRDLNQLSESVVIEATKEGVKFSCQGDIGSGSVTVRQHTNVEKPDQNVSIALSEPVALTFSLKYLVNFCKATNLSGHVTLCLSQEVPLMVEYGLGSGHLRFYLAPKIGDEE